MYDMRPRVCAVCGKIFYPAPLHQYRKEYRRKTYLACSYSCFRALEEEINKQKDGRKRQ